MQERTRFPALNLPEIQPLLANADYIDVKTVTGNVDLRTFIAGMFNYRPAWMMSLYALRAVFVRFLGMRQEKRGFGALLTPETVPMQVGKLAFVFTVRIAEEGRYWFADNSDRHLKATLGVVLEPLADQQKRFYIVTVVHYHNWTGPVYLQVIKPFHHLVVISMARAGVKRSA
jgi:hypothetical protein